MFTWICPQCGREVPPAYDECPDCKERAAQEAQAAQPAPPQPPPESQPPAYPPPGYQQAPPYPYPPPQYPPQYQQPVYPPQGYPPYPPQGYPPQGQYPPPYPPPAYQPPPPPQGAPQQQPAYQPPPNAAPPQPAYPPPPPPAASSTVTPSVTPVQPPVKVRPYTPPPEPAGGMPAWLMTLLVTAGVLAVVVGGVWLFSSHGHTDAKPSPTVESPAAKAGAPTNPYQKYIEVAGVRFQEDPKHKDKTEVRFLLVNHSDAEIEGLAGNVTVWGATRKSEEDAQGTFTFKTDLKPLESKELTEPLNSKLKIYELPDWQNVTTDVQITSPKAQ